MNIEQKEERYRILIDRILQNKGKVTSGLYDIGLDLKEIKERELYLLEFRYFNEFLEKRVEINRRTAYRCISVASTFTLRDFLKFGLKKLDIIKSELKEPEKMKEFMKSVTRGIHTQELTQKLRRFKGQIGSIEHSDDTKLTLIRQFETLKAWQLETFNDLKESWIKWIEKAFQMAENSGLETFKKEASELLKKVS